MNGISSLQVWYQNRRSRSRRRPNIRPQISRLPSTALQVVPPQYTGLPAELTTPTDPLTASKDPLTASRDPLTASMDPFTASRDPLTASRDPLTASRDHLTASWDPLTASRDPLTASKDPFTASRDPLTASRDPLTASRDHLTASWDPLTANWNKKRMEPRKTLRFSPFPMRAPSQSVGEENTPFTPVRPWETKNTHMRHTRQVAALYPVQTAESGYYTCSAVQHSPEFICHINPLVSVDNFSHLMVQSMMAPILAPPSSGTRIIFPSFHNSDDI